MMEWALESVAAVQLPQAETIVADLLDILRRQLDVDVAVLARSEQGELVVQVIRGDPGSLALTPGVPLTRDSGLLASLLGGDTRPGAVRSTASAPVFDSDGGIYGVLACLTTRPHPARNAARDERFLRLMAAFLTDSVLDLQEMWTRRRRVWQEVSDLIDDGGPQVVFQPILRLSDRRIVGLEALSRFPDLTAAPQHWYANAATVGLATELERIAIHGALRVLPMLPPHLTLTVNVSPSTLVAGLVDALPPVAAGRLVMEITEHEHISDDQELLCTVGELRARGIRVAIDDIGTGYAGLAQLLRLRPEIIKLDGVITRGIDTDAARRAIAAGLVEVAREIGGRVVAEGIETPRELATVEAAGIGYGQGFLLGRPAPASEVTQDTTTAARIAGGPPPRAPRPPARPDRRVCRVRFGLPPVDLPFPPPRRDPDGRILLRGWSRVWRRPGRVRSGWPGGMTPSGQIDRGAPDVA
ncbi:EAL domain-containing protein [Candidatus Frankia nodulisporulans]|uniref:EAL domain-containing protein n=1 Tax=Candidatus Frankia nodulisporulans TaxID=2060052 RepID=UPI0013D6E189|nr:EAL domain-containing protein [Candidatus Frankia nodulisporulans]